MMKHFQNAVMKAILLCCCLTYVNASHAQSKFGTGIGTVLCIARNPGPAVIPYLLYRNNDHEVLAGPDLYSGQLGFASIIGAEAEYRFHFWHFNDKLNMFASIYGQYIRFATGPARAVPFNYSESIAPGMNYSMVKTRSFSNTLGIGVQYSFCKIFGLHFMAGVGYNFYRNALSEDVSASFVDRDLLGSRFTFAYAFKIGLSAKLAGARTP